MHILPSGSISLLISGPREYSEMIFSILLVLVPIGIGAILMPGFLTVVIVILILGVALFSYSVLHADKIPYFESACKKCSYKWLDLNPDANEIPKKIKLYEVTLKFTQKHKNREKRGYAFSNMSFAACNFQGDCQQGVAFGEQSLALFRELGNKRGMGYALSNLGAALTYLGRYEQATQFFQECLAITQEIKDWQNMANAYYGQAFVLMYQHKFEEAKLPFRQSLTLFQKMEIKEMIARNLENMAEVALSQQQPVRAAQLFGAEEALREANNIAVTPLDRPRYEYMVRLLTNHLDTPTFLATWREGKQMPLEQAINLVLA